MPLMVNIFSDQAKRLKTEGNQSFLVRMCLDKLFSDIDRLAAAAPPPTMAEYLMTDHGQADILARIIEALRKRDELGRRGGHYTRIGGQIGFPPAQVSKSLRAEKPLKAAFVVAMAKYLGNPDIAQVPPGT